MRNLPCGLHVEKTLRLTAPETVEATYRVSLGAAAPSAPGNDPGSKQSFISMLSVPATDSEEGSTHFCWQPAVSSASTRLQPLVPSPGPAHIARILWRLASPITIPAEITRLEIQSSGRSTLTVEWTSAHAIIVPKIFSAQIEFAHSRALAGCCTR